MDDARRDFEGVKFEYLEGQRVYKRKLKRLLTQIVDSLGDEPAVEKLFSPQ